jgi:hypothetical protein
MKIEWKTIRQRSTHFVLQARSVTTIREWLSLLCELVTEIFQSTVQYVVIETKSRRDLNIAKPYRRVNSVNDEMYAIATTWTACYIFAVITLAMLTHQLRVLFGLFLVVVAKVGGVVIKWIVFILEDPELYKSYAFLRSWLGLLIKEGESIVSSDAAWKLAMTYTVVSQVPTGLSYLQYIIRYKTRLLRKEFLRELGVNRFGGRSFFLSSQINASFQSGVQITRKLSSSLVQSTKYHDEIWESDAE